jgi:rhodanese-related sulfurtransferase
MKKIRRIIALALCAATVLSASLAAGCSQGGESGTSEITTNASDSQPTVEGIDLAGYKIVYADNQTSTVRKEVNSLVSAVQDINGSEMERTKDASDAADAKEIIIGDTASGKSAEALAVLTAAGYVNGYIIRVDGTRIVINGTNADSTAIAVRKFTESMIAKSGADKAVCTASGDTVEKLADELISIDGKAYLQVESKTVVYEPTKANPNVTLTYAKIIVLEHNGENNGQIFVTGESLDEEAYIVHVSTDGGKTFNIRSRIKTNKSGMVANWQPCIYELPCAVGDMPEGTLIFAGCVRDYATATRTEITLWKSTDLGETWSTLSVCATGGGLTGDVAGLWEPFLYAEDGKLYCLYSDETDPDHSQMLSLKYTSDGKKWSDRVIIIACAEKDLRPGMVSMTKLPTGEYFVTYEMVGMSGNPIHYKKTTDLTDWGDTSTTGTKITTKGGNRLGSSPYCAWTPLGGENGMIIVTGMFMGSGSSKTGTDWLVSFDLGKTWKSCDNPLPYTSGNHRYAYSPGLFVASDGSIYYVNDINCESSRFKDKASITMAYITVIS